MVLTRFAPSCVCRNMLNNKHNTLITKYHRGGFVISSETTLKMYKWYRRNRGISSTNKASLSNSNLHSAAAQWSINQHKGMMIWWADGQTGGRVLTATPHRDPHQHSPLTAHIKKSTLFQSWEPQSLERSQRIKKKRKRNGQIKRGSWLQIKPLFLCRSLSCLLRYQFLQLSRSTSSRRPTFAWQARFID